MQLANKLVCFCISNKCRWRSSAPSLLRYQPSSWQPGAHFYLTATANQKSGGDEWGDFASFRYRF